MAGTKRSASAANLDFPSPLSDTSDPVDVLFFYAGQCTENEAPVSTDGVREAIAEIEERGLPHDADRRKVLFGTLMRGKGKRAPHPSWVVQAVRQLWPAERTSATGESLGYMGYKAS
ncbi:hypothetical protein CYMTET_47201 [Cymbomonas tetramitiformis]|uniref:Uncharacterized protein n=1 Tax=Cymbomonas tetramitiformis TaxID=36881 RepID=A0AAE0BWF6_9CHLO|nr:hypothetical protein CYMTET_47201 [Cymbomonas tetramitiformis]